MTSPLVDAAWLAGHLEGVVLADIRWSVTGGTAEAERAFESGHIPTAVLFDVDRDLAAQPFDGPGRHPLPRPEVFARTLSAAGITDDVLVVAYDDVQGSLAARLWWMLDVTGRRAALLDGGLPSWGGARETGPGRARATSTPVARPWPSERVAAAEDVIVALGGATGVVLDARAPERYRGEVEPIDPAGGHIPGSRNAAWTGNLDADGHFLPPTVLRQRYDALGVRSGDGTIAHCGSGVTTCHDLFAMRLAGLGDARLYEGSWSDWLSDPTRPIATGAEPGSLG